MQFIFENNLKMEFEFFFILENYKTPILFMYFSKCDIITTLVDAKIYINHDKTILFLI